MFMEGTVDQVTGNGKWESGLFGVHKIPVSVYAVCMWTTFKIIMALVICYAAVTAWIYLSQRRILYFPVSTMVATPAKVGLAYSDVWLINRLGTKIHAWWLPHEDARFIVLFSHGNGGNISHRLETLRIFNELGLSVLVYDYSGYGQSLGEPGEASTRADARAAWDWLVDEQDVRPDSIILMGRSLGGAVTAGLAGDLGREGVLPAGLVLESTFTSVPDMGAHIYPWLPVRQLVRYQYNAVEDLSDVRLPALFAHSRDDDIVPYALGHRLHESYSGPKMFLELSGDHNGGYMLMGQAYLDGLNRFLTTLEQGNK